MHHFSLGKPQKYTHPNKKVAGFLLGVVIRDASQGGNFAKIIKGELIEHKKSKRPNNNPHLGVGLMLMRIAFQALGMAEELLPPISQEDVQAKAKSLSLAPNQCDCSTEGSTMEAEGFV